jgi:hypothetical protein
MSSGTGPYVTQDIDLGESLQTRRSDQRVELIAFPEGGYGWVVTASESLGTRIASKVYQH